MPSAYVARTSDRLGGQCPPGLRVGSGHMPGGRGGVTASTSAPLTARRRPPRPWRRLARPSPRRAGAARWTSRSQRRHGGLAFHASSEASRSLGRNVLEASVERHKDVPERAALRPRRGNRRSSWCTLASARLSAAAGKGHVVRRDSCVRRAATGADVASSFVHLVCAGASSLQSRHRAD